MEKSDIQRKKNKLKELHELENDINKQINVCSRKINGYLYSIKLEIQQKEKLAKRVSHNMKLRNKIIDELNSLL